MALVRVRFAGRSGWRAWFDLLRLRDAYTHSDPGPELRLLLFCVRNSCHASYLLAKYRCRSEELRMARWGSSAYRSDARVLAALLRITLSRPPRGYHFNQSHVFEQCGKFRSGRSCDLALFFQPEPGKKTLLSHPVRISVGQWDSRSYPGLLRAEARLA